jgi:hypothetical protein
MKNELPVIDFEGKQVKPTKYGVYKCPFKCGNPSYSEPTWKTEKGFRKHMDSCPKRPSNLQQQKDNEEIERSYFETLKAEILATIPIKVGDVLPVVREVILKPTHVQRFNRMVRVRYEAVKRFDALEIEVRKIDIIHTKLTDKNYIRDNFLYINDEFRLSSICTSLPAARDRAIQMQKSYAEACKFASDCR